MELFYLNIQVQIMNYGFGINAVEKGVNFYLIYKNIKILTINIYRYE